MTNSHLHVHTCSEKAILDSGCTSHFVTSSTKCINKVPTANSVRVGIANGDIMTATHNATLYLPHLPVQLDSRACKVSVHPALQKSLISLGKLCDNRCDYVLLEKRHASIIKDGVTSIISLRDPTNGMWLVDLEPSGTPTVLPDQHPTYQYYANSVYEHKTKVELIDFLHRACFSPPISTCWVQAIGNNIFTTWPGLTAAAIQKCVPKSLVTDKGHLKASPQNLPSTSKDLPTISTIEAPTVMTTPPSTPEPTVRTHLVYAKVVTITGQIDSNQTGRFPVTSSKGNKYIMVVYDFDSVAILAEPIKNRTESELLRAYSRMHQYLTDRGLKPQLQKLDNECSTALRQFMRKANVVFQRVPPTTIARTPPNA
jgi:hypothetical protein